MEQKVGRAVWRCSHCGLVVEAISGMGPPVCCGAPMELLAENSVDAAKEKHVPVAETRQNGFLVKVGEIAHPMLPEHFIEWIEVDDGARMIRQYLRPGQMPEAFFELPLRDCVKVRAYCNRHGLWKKL